MSGEFHGTEMKDERNERKEERTMKTQVMSRLKSALAAAALSVLAGTAFAANPASMTLKVTVNVGLSVALSASSYDFGLINAGAVVVSSNGVTVTNDSGGRTEDYTVDASTYMASGGASWTISGSSTAAANVFALCARLNSVQPSSSTFANGDCLDQTAGNQQNMDASHFAGDQNGNNVPAAATRSLWFLFAAPTSISGGGNVQQTMTLTVTANDSSLF